MLFLIKQKTTDKWLINSSSTIKRHRAAPLLFPILNKISFTQISTFYEITERKNYWKHV